MEFLKSHRHRSRLSEVAYIILNLLLAAARLATTYASNAPWIALALMLLSKWRIFAVRPRLWIANLIANMVDIIVGLSYVALLYSLSGLLLAQIVLTVLYAGWLLLIKPRSKYIYMVVQAGLALFLGLTTLSMVAYEWNVAYFVAIAWVIGYVVARHIMNTYDQAYSNLYSLTAGLVTAEMGWISYHWLIAYPIPGISPVRLSQYALFMTLFYFVAERAFRSHHTHGSVRRNDVLPAIILTALVLIVTYIFAIIYGSDAL